MATREGRKYTDHELVLTPHDTYCRGQRITMRSGRVYLEDIFGYQTTLVESDPSLFAGPHPWGGQWVLCR